jgi:hypothetical protein
MRISDLLLKHEQSLSSLAIGRPLQQAWSQRVCASLRWIVWRRMLQVRVRFIGPSCVDSSTILERHCAQAQRLP